MVRRKHKVLGIPVLGPVIGSLVTILLAEGLFGGIGNIIDQAMFGGENMAYPYFAAIGGVLALFLYKKWFQGEFRGSMSGNYGDSSMRRILLIGAAVDLVFLALAYITGGVQAPGVVMLGISLMAGICEEVSFRVVPISCVMRNSKGAGSVVMAMAVSVIAFSLIHLTNISAGQSVAGTLVQIVSCLGSGIFFGAIYLRTGNILITIVWHFVYDFLAQLQRVAENGLVDSASLTSVLTNLALSAILCVLGIMLIYGHTAEIEAVWKERWNQMGDE